MAAQAMHLLEAYLHQRSMAYAYNPHTKVYSNSHSSYDDYLLFLELENKLENEHEKLVKGASAKR